MALDKSILENLAGFEFDETVSTTIGFTKSDGTISPIDPIISNNTICPTKPLEQKVLQDLANRFSTCAAAQGEGAQSCLAIEYVINQYVNLDSLRISGHTAKCPGEEPEVEIVPSQQLLETDDEIDRVVAQNGNAALGTLLLPYLYIRWGETLLHNSFPSFLLDDGVPQLKNNVAGLEITIETSSSGGSSSGGSGNESGGVSTCELTLNPHLVDHEGKDIIVQTDGAELIVIYGYPNSNQVRRLVFAQVGIKDKYYNEQSTQVSFRGRSWKLTRLHEQRRYPSTENMTERVRETMREICNKAGYDTTEDRCKLEIIPPNAFDNVPIGETVQNESLIEYLTRIVEQKKGCKLNQAESEDAAGDGNFGTYKITIDCANALEDEIEEQEELVTNLVDRALWLGQGLVETIELSDVGDSAGAHSNTGGNCGRNRRPSKLRPKNIVLKGFSTGCDYILLNRTQISDNAAGAQGQFLLRLSKDDSDEVPLLAPFNGTITKKGPNPECNNTEASDNKCGDESVKIGSGNFITLKAENSTDENLNNLEWTFYHIAGTTKKVGDTIESGETIATQGSSGSVNVKITGIRLDREGTRLSEEEALPFIDDYRQTITFSCKDLIEGSCKSAAIRTSPNLKGGGGAPNHIHYDNKNGVQGAIEGFDAMAASDPDSCYNLNKAGNVPRTGNEACWDPTWDDELKFKIADACWKTHTHSKNWQSRYRCDFWVFDKTTANRQGNTGRFGESASLRPVAIPFPNDNYVFVDTTPSGGTDYGSAVVFYKEGQAVPSNTLGFGNDTGFAQLLHIDRQSVKDAGISFGETFEGCADGGDSDAELDAETPISDDVIFQRVSTIVSYMESNNLHIRKPPATEPASSYATNIVGLRGVNEDLTANNDAIDEWNDLIVVFGINKENKIRIYTYAVGTTQPSEYYITQRPFATAKDDGAAIMIADKSYIGIWREGAHLCEGGLNDNTGKCIKPALVQAKEITISRDKNNDGQVDPDNLFTGNFGINFHHSRGGPIDSIAKSSAGCQVLFSKGTPNDPWQSAKQGWQNDYRYKENSNATFDYVLIDGNTFVPKISEDPEENEFLQDEGFIQEELNQDCGGDGKYAASDEQMDVLNKYCAEKGCNAKDIAAFIQAECSWNIKAVNRFNCYGAFQCCQQGAPVAQMKALLASNPNIQWNDCSDTIKYELRDQLTIWEAYKEATKGVSGGVPIETGTLCEHYTEIALPALVPAVQRNGEALYFETCKDIGVAEQTCRNFFKNNATSWFLGKTLNTAKVRGVCDYAKRGAVNDPRLNGGCSFSGGAISSAISSSDPCTNSSVNRSLNARNTGTLSTGGLQNIKFRQEIRLNAEFGICPRNVFLAPTDAKGRPMYILLANMDNSEGFADFKIRSTTLTWNGNFRWSVTAFRPADEVKFELPPTVIQPRSLNEWISYYWLYNRSFFAEANQFAPPGRRVQTEESGALRTGIDVAGNDVATNETLRLIKDLFDDFYDTFRKNNPQALEDDISFNQEDSVRFFTKAGEIKSQCAGGRKQSCLETIEGYRDTESFSVISIYSVNLTASEDSNRVPISTWLRENLTVPLAENSDRADKILN